MSDVTRILSQIEQGDPQAAEELLPLVYEELRKLAAAKLAQEKPGQTLQATALVHAAYLRLGGGEKGVGNRESGVGEKETGDGEARSEVRNRKSEDAEATSDLCDHRSAAMPATSDRWDSRGHFFAAAAEAMRRILVDSACRKAALQRGGGQRREDVDLDGISCRQPPEFVLAIDEALKKLATENEPAARLVALRYFAGLTAEQAAQTLGVTDRTARCYWVYAKA
jgi:RNA polymerase sigma factor (TIGR02999 family)